MYNLQGVCNEPHQPGKGRGRHPLRTDETESMAIKAWDVMIDVIMVMRLRDRRGGTSDEFDGFKNTARNTAMLVWGQIQEMSRPTVLIMM